MNSKEIKIWKLPVVTYLNTYFQESLMKTMVNLKGFPPSVKCYLIHKLTWPLEVGIKGERL